MSLIHRWPFTTGSGSTVADSVGGSSYDFTPIAGDQVNWASGKVFGVQRNFMTIGWTRFPRNDGFLYNGTGLASDLDDFSICYVARFLAGWIRDGTFFKIGRNFRTYGYTTDLVNSTRQIAVESDIDWGNFMTYIITGRSARYFDAYLNDSITTPAYSQDSGYTGGFRLSASEFRLNSLTDTTFPGSMELADLSIYDHALTESDRQDYIDQFYTTLPTAFSFQRTDNNDFGGLVRWDEYGASGGSELTIESFEGSNVVKHSADGATCQVATACEIRRDLEVIHMEVDQYIPSNITGNHAIGSTWDVLSLYDTPHTGHRIIVRCRHYLPDNDVKLYQITYVNSVGTTNYTLTNDEVTLGAWHNFRMKVDVTNGTIDFWYDNVSYAALTGLTLDLDIKQAYWGLCLGVHLESPGNYYYMKNHYVGETQKTTESGSGSAKQFKRNALGIILDKKGKRYGSD